MELDGVEVILRIEDEFSISISDDEVGATRTVGDLCDLVIGKLDGSASCASSKAFYRTRKAIVDTLGLPRRSVRPSTWLEPLLPQPTRIKRWKEIAARSQLEFPRLAHAKGWRDGFVLISMALAALPVIAVWWAFYALGWLPGILVWLFGIPALVGWVVLISLINQRLLMATPKLAYEIPSRTAGDLAMGVLAMNYEVFDPLGATQAPPSREFVSSRIVEILSDQLQIEPGNVRRDARIVEDLGVS
jgi:acyl carrier protein